MRSAPLISSTVELLAAEILLQQRLVGLGDGLEQLGPVLVGLLSQLGRNVDGVVGLAELGLATPHLGVHLDQVDDALELALRADRQLDGMTFAPRRSSIVRTEK